MNEHQKITVDLDITVNDEGILHDMGVTTEGYNADDTQRIKEVINEDVKYFIEDIRRRLFIL